VFAGKVTCGVRNETSGQSWPSNTVATDAFYQGVADRIISNLKAGMIPWEERWKAPRFAGGLFPRNTGKPCRPAGESTSFCFWLTFKQAQALKGNVGKGEHGTPIVFCKQLLEIYEEGRGRHGRG
jgi:antirestriction protein ArdC